MVVGIFEKSRRLRNAYRLLFGITTPESPLRLLSARCTFPLLRPGLPQCDFFDCVFQNRATLTPLTGRRASGAPASAASVGLAQPGRDTASGRRHVRAIGLRCDLKTRLKQKISRDS